jgi:hypothetical protein
MSDGMIAALIKAQAGFKPAVKDAVNPHFKSKYVTLQAAIDAVLPALHANGFALVQSTRLTEGRTILNTALLHTSGGKLESDYPVHPVKADPQGEGSALTYARRYALMALCGIAPEDDDGNAAVAAVTPTAGVWERLDPDEQAWLEKVAAEVGAHLATDAAAAADHLKAQQLDADEKAAIWTRFDSKQRSALKKAMA